MAPHASCRGMGVAVGACLLPGARHKCGLRVQALNMPPSVEIHKIPVVYFHDLPCLLTTLVITSLHGNHAVTREQFLLIALEMVVLHIPKSLDEAIKPCQYAMRFAADIQ